MKIDLNNMIILIKIFYGQFLILDWEKIWLRTKKRTKKNSDEYSSEKDKNFEKKIN